MGFCRSNRLSLQRTENGGGRSGKMDRMASRNSSENRSRRASVSLNRTLHCAIPGWSAGIQVDLDVSGGILANLVADNPCRHDEDLHFHPLVDHGALWRAGARS